MSTNLATRRYRLGLDTFTGGIAYFAIWIVLIVVGAAVLPAIIAQYRSIDISTWYHAVNAGKIFTAIVGGVMIYAMLPNMVAQGLTRRELATSYGLFGLLWSVAFGALAIGGLVAEHSYYSALGWTQAIDQDSANVPLETVTEAFQFGLYYPLVYAVYFAGGALIGAAIYRSDHGWFTIAAVVPIGLALDDMVSSGEPWGPGWLVRAATGLTEGVSRWGSIPIALGFIIIGAWVTRRCILSSPIRSKQA